MSHLKVVGKDTNKTSNELQYFVEIGFIGGSILSVITDEKQYIEIRVGISEGNIMDIKTSKGVLTITGESVSYLYKVPFTESVEEHSESTN